MTKILITGTKESGKDTVLDIVLTGSKRIFPEYKFIDMKPIIRDSIPKKRGQVKKPKSFDDFKASDMIKIKENVMNELEAVLSKPFKTHAIVSGYFTLKTKAGYVPLFTQTIMEKFKPDVIINFELDTNPYSDDDKAETLRIMRHQHANRMIASSYAASHGIIVKTIIVHENNIKHAIKELSRTLEYYLGI